MATTPHVGALKYSYDDVVDIEVLDANQDLFDAKIGQLETTLTDVASDAATALQPADIGTRVPTLVDGKVSSDQLPSITINNVYPVVSQAAMLALSANVGDTAIRSDVSKTFILAAIPASTLSNWLELPTPSAPVLSVNGRTGAVTGLYEKPVGGIPESDLASSVTDALDAVATTVTLAGTQTVSGLKTYSAKQTFNDLLQVETAGTLYVKGTTSLHGNTYAPRVLIRNDEGDGSQTGLMVTNVNTDGFDQARRLGLFHYKGARSTAGSLLLVNVEKTDVAAVTTLAFEGQAATVQGTSAVASHLGGVAGITLHRSNGTIGYARALITTTQVDCGVGNSTPGALTNAYGLFVDRPQTFSTGSITNFRGVYVSGNADTGLDSAGTAYTPSASWRGVHVALPPSGPTYVRSLDIEGRSSFANSASGDVIIDGSVIGDSQTRFRLLSSGAQQWGDGTNAVDCTLQRRAAKVMEWASTVMRFGQFTTASKPGAGTAGSGAFIWVSDPATAGQNLQVSDGSVWKYIPLSALT